jgi:hypothetical protein
VRVCTAFRGVSRATQCTLAGQVAAQVSACGVFLSESPPRGYSAAMNNEKPDTTQSDSGPARAGDVVSDPAKSDGASGDWSDEGGATPSGPADTGDHTQ